jgi:hypothetical protein
MVAPAGAGVVAGSEVKHLALAQTAVGEASMWAIKAATT